MANSASQPSDRQALVAFYDAFERVRDQVEREENERVRRIPSLSAFLPKLLAAGHVDLERQLERQALLDGNWEPYLRQLKLRGALYARLCLPFEEWYSTLTPVREVLCDAAVGSEAKDIRAIMRGMGRYFDLVLCNVAGSYIETKQSLATDAESQADLYVAMFRNAPVGMLLYEWVDPPDPGSFRLLAANPMAAELGSAPIYVHVGHTLQETSPHLLATDVPAHFAAAIETGESRDWTVENLGRIHEVRSFRVRDRYLGVVFDDVTLQRRMAAEIERHIQELERSNRSLDEFAYVASHDLKAPLRDIDNLAKWIVEDVGDVMPAASQRHLERLQERVVRMERLLDDLLDYSRAGRVSVPAEQFDVRAAIDDALQLIRLPPGFEVSVRTERVAIHSPRVPLAQILRNLVQNAIKHHHSAAGRIVITVEDGPERVEIAVADDGPGIPPEFHERVFRMFQTLRPRDQVEGSGMGLAIVAKLVEAHHGKVRIESDGRSGTTIRFSWPKQWPKPAGNT